MAAGYNINQAINPPMPGPGAFKAAHVAQAGFASMIETRLGGWMSLLYRSNSFDGTLTHTTNFSSQFNDEFAVIPQGVGFITRRDVTNFSFQFGTTGSSGSFASLIKRNGGTGGTLNAGKYYLFPVENVPAAYGSVQADEANIGGAGSWPMTDHQWFLNNNTTANIPYSRGFQHTVVSDGTNDGLPGAGTYSDGDLRLNINFYDAYQPDDFLLIDMYGMCIRRG